MDEVFHFPRWLNRIRLTAFVVASAVPVYVLAILYYGGHPRTTDVGYAPDQPVPFSHALHAGQLGMDCRYCHSTVEKAAFAAVPPTEVCMNCHSLIWAKSPKLEPVRESWKTGKPVEWVKVHDLPDYAYFNHSAHVVRGVSCVECHGRIDRMEKVQTVETLSMGWCLTCHRAPEAHLRDPKLVTNLKYRWDWTTEQKKAEGATWKQALNLHPSEQCSTCHR